MTTQKRFNRFLIYAALVILAAVFLVPAYTVVVTSLKSPDQINQNTVWNLPETWYPQSFFEAWEAFAPNLMNSFSLVIPATILSAMLGSLKG